MSKADLLDRMRANPRGDWRISDVMTVCRRHGVECDPPRGGGSHYGVAHPRIARKLAVPARRPIKAVYIHDLVEFIDEVRTLP